MIPSNIGKLVLFVYAKEKSSITENDIALAYVEAQRKRMIQYLKASYELEK